MINVLFQFHRKSDSSRWWFFVLSASFALMFISCSDLQKESSTSACNTALNQQDWDTAISTCTSSKGLGDAYMGKGGFNITNLRLGYEWDNGAAVFLDKKIGRSSFEKFYELNFPNFVSFGFRIPILKGGTLRGY